MPTDLVNKIIAGVSEWRKAKYPGVTATTKRLLDYWFKEQKSKPDGTPVNYWHCQREAIETLIYINEVCKYRSLYEMIRGFTASMLFDPATDLWPRYCFKMATGSGKTIVMALAVVWQYFNKLHSEDSGVPYTQNYLVLAPNLIVMDRLMDGFGDRKIFTEYALVPPEWRPDFDLQVVKQAEGTTRTATGLLHVTNIQQLYEREKAVPVNPVEKLIGAKPKPEEEAELAVLRERVAELDNLLVINDEAHHVHSPELKWWDFIQYLHEVAQSRGSELTAQLDFSATPKDLQGYYFPHIIYDYPLAKAIDDKIVKRPRIGEIEDAPPSIRKDFVAKNQVQIDTGIEIHKKFCTDFKLFHTGPVLFVMCDNTKHADEVGRYLEANGYKGRVLVIHTDTKGNITKKDLDRLRVAAREIDAPDSPYEAIVSVMMLKEGWDVKSVNIIVPLRAFDSPILPEQTLGRGLRRICRDDLTQEEPLIVIDHPRFRSLWEAEIEKGELVADFVKAREVYEKPNIIQVDQNKLQYDIEFPILTGGITRVKPDLSHLDIGKLPKKAFKFDEVKVPKVMYKEKDLLSQKIVREKILAFDYTENLSLYISYIASAVFAKVRCIADLPGIVDKLKEYIAKHLFDREIDPNSLDVRRKLNNIQIRLHLVEKFAEAVNELAKSTEPVTLHTVYRVSWVGTLHTYEPVVNVDKCVFNALPYPKRSQFEHDFIKWLDSKEEVLAFTKVLAQLPLLIPYHNHEGFLAYYRPDFIVKTEKVMYLIETKGIQDENVTLKDAAAKEWCKKASELSGVEWKYVKVKYDDFQQLAGQSFGSLLQYCVAIV